MKPYETLKLELAQGWNTWNTRSVLSHVLLPEGFALNLGVKEYFKRDYLKEALIGRHNPEAETIVPGLRTYDGSYTELTLSWRGVELRVESAAVDGDVVLLVTPLSRHLKTPLLVVESGILWNRPGTVTRSGETLIGRLPNREVEVRATRACRFEDPNIAAQTPYLALPLDGPVGIFTGPQRTQAEIEAILHARRAAHEAHLNTFGVHREIYTAIQTCLAWDTIYDPESDRVISPVSRIWNVNWGGFVLFDWDTYFAALMFGLGNKALAYANAIEITREHTERGFVPNFATVCDFKSRDRSQPPVGSRIFLELYRRFGDRWVLEEVFEDLLAWNRWWPKNRDQDGLLCWGSDPYQPRIGADWEMTGLASTQGAAFESGLDNSPMYDGVPYHEHTHLAQLADVGLNGMYVMDCEALVEIAVLLGRPAEEQELRARGAAYRAALAGLWDETSGLFLNRRTDTGEFSHRLSPTLFYGLLARAATQDQAERMVREHLSNPDEFWGPWVLPSIARSDPAFPDQDYWRGRIWGPLNFLVYLGLRNYDLPQACAELATKSAELLLHEWRQTGFVCENYSALTGRGGEIHNSDAYYHWGGLLGMPALMESGAWEKRD